MKQLTAKKPIYTKKELLEYYRNMCDDALRVEAALQKISKGAKITVTYDPDCISILYVISDIQYMTKIWFSQIYLFDDNVRMFYNDISFMLYKTIKEQNK